MIDGIRDGWLADIDIMTIESGIDFRTIRKVGTDLDLEELSARMMVPEALAVVADPIIRTIDRTGSCIVFCCSVAHSRAQARVLNERSGSPDFAISIDGTSSDDERRHAIERAKDGTIRCLVNCALLTEGFDWPAVGAVAIARPTMSRPLYVQMVGRGTRIAQGKSRVTVIDYVGDNHELCCAVDIFAGHLGDDVAARAKRAASDREGEVVDRLELFASAEEEHRAATMEAQYEVSRRDPFAAIGVDTSVFRRRSVLTQGVTESQRTRLLWHKMSAKVVDGLTRRQAEQVVAELDRRRELGLCTPKQARVLARLGIAGETVTFDAASDIITAMNDAGWDDDAGIARARDMGIVVEDRERIA